jgi:hypothetical protein
MGFINENDKIIKSQKEADLLFNHLTGPDQPLKKDKDSVMRSNLVYVEILRIILQIIIQIIDIRYVKNKPVANKGKSLLFDIQYDEFDSFFICHSDIKSI